MSSIESEATGLERSSHRIGAEYLGQNKTRFLVWAPKAATVDVHLFSPADRLEPLRPAGPGYFSAELAGVGPGARYKYRLNESAELPDPASRSQPEGVHGPSEVISSEFPWTDQDWGGIPLGAYVFYELHVGTYTPEGTFEAVIDHLDELKELGVTAVELMPVAQFPGQRNWGYDGVYPFAVQASYGGPQGLKKLVNAAHGKGLAVVLDVVYNHLGPEGNYLGQYGHYFTGRYSTPWGQAVNFDGEDSREVRRYILENATDWIREFHIDALRLDAVHSIHDSSHPHILREIGEAVRRSTRSRRVHVIAESDLNDVSVVRPAEDGGYGLDAQWSDDFHHAVHSLLTSERTGYYLDFGSLHHLAKALEEGFVYSGQFSEHRGKPHGTSSRDIPGRRFVVCTQNHDQIGNRMLGERLSHLLYGEGLKLAAATLLLSPFLPMLFMGQEYGERAPFLYFVDHSDPGLIQAVREGRKREFESFRWKGDVPDAQAESTFLQSKLRHELKKDPGCASMLELYRELLRLRSSITPLRNLSKEHCKVTHVDQPPLIILNRWYEQDDTLTLLHFGSADCTFDLVSEPGVWRKALDTADTRWLGPGGQMPGRIETSGIVEVRMPRSSACLLVRTED